MRHRHLVARKHCAEPQETGDIGFESEPSVEAGRDVERDRGLVPPSRSAPSARRSHGSSERTRPRGSCRSEAGVQLFSAESSAVGRAATRLGARRSPLACQSLWNTVLRSRLAVRMDGRFSINRAFAVACAAFKRRASAARCCPQRALPSKSCQAASIEHNTT